MTKTLAALFACLMLTLLNSTNGSAQSIATCHENTTAPRTAPYRWAPASEVHIVFSPGDFQKPELAAFNKALEIWQQELSRSEINIKLINDGAKSGRGNRSILVSRKDDLPVERQAQFVALAAANGYFTAGEVAIKKDIRKSDRLARLLQHELGHAFGLMDCLSCRYGSTIMRMHNLAVNGFSIGKLLAKEGLGLTACDRQSLTNGYGREADSGLEIGPGTIVGNDDGEDVVTKSDFDTTAAEVGDGKTLLDNAGLFSPESTIAEKRLLHTLLSSETTNARALNNYAFKRDVLIETVGEDGNVTGSYHRVSQLVFDDAGRRIEKILLFPKPTLKHLIITSEDVADLAGVQLLGWETGKADLYRIVAAGSDPQTGQLLFRVMPRDLRQAKVNGDRVFYGTIWVDQTAMQIVKVKGRALPEGNQRFPVFETERGQVTQGIWGPLSTFADETLVFPNRKVRMRMKVRYFDYREFRSKVTITEVDSQ